MLSRSEFKPAGSFRFAHDLITPDEMSSKNNRTFFGMKKKGRASKEMNSDHGSISNKLYFSMSVYRRGMKEKDSKSGSEIFHTPNLTKGPLA